jgi:hypothetical protein
VWGNAKSTVFRSFWACNLGTRGDTGVALSHFLIGSLSPIQNTNYLSNRRPFENFDCEGVAFVWEKHKKGRFSIFLACNLGTRGDTGVALSHFLIGSLSPIQNTNHLSHRRPFENFDCEGVAFVWEKHKKGRFSIFLGL